jgi:hypothetical protein
VIESDVLKVDFTQLAQSLGDPKAEVVGNLPYNISTPILFHLLDHVQVVIEDQHFMLQKEVIDRMVAAPATSDYSRLSVMLQWRYAMDNVLFVPPASFDPPPRVDSAVVRMVPLAEPPAVDVARCSARWCRWPSASAARSCATPSASGWSKKALLASSMSSAGPKKCPSTNTLRWFKSCPQPSMKKPVGDGLSNPEVRRPTGRAGWGRARYAAASQYPALKGLLMRSASGDTSTSLSVGIFSPLSVVRSIPAGAAPVVPSVP